jgi:NAD(P)-dependent dehydrogenase (short-subunit alcohol dehydrogenase family)
MLACGANVAINGYDTDETTHAAMALNGEFAAPPALHRRAVALPGDLADPTIAQSLVLDAAVMLGDLHAVVCNAGIDIIQPALDYTPEQWDRILDVNLRGAFLVAQAAARHWIAHDQRECSITFTSSIAGHVGIPTLAPYAASKGGMNQLVRTLAVEWAMHGIRVNAVAPGYVQNIMDGVTAHGDPASEERISRFTPLGRRATVDEIAAPFVFLAAPAASYITGAILAVDGGYTAI